MTAVPVQFFYHDVRFSFPKRTVLKKFITKLFSTEKHQLQQINIIFCTDEALLAMNRDFLQHDYYTDIITFPLSGKGDPINAELYISVDRVKDNAKMGGVSFQKELQRVIFHGCLHLTGFNDKSSQQIKKMREREEHYLHLYFKQVK